MASSSYPSMPFSISTVCCPTSGGGLGCDTANSLYLTAGPVKKIREREKGNYFQKLLPVFILKCLRQFKGKYFIFMAVLSESLRQKCYILELQTKKIPVQNNVPISWFKVVHPNAELLNICSTLRKSSPCSQW